MEVMNTTEGNIYLGILLFNLKNEYQKNIKKN